MTTKTESDVELERYEAERKRYGGWSDPNDLSPAIPDSRGKHSDEELIRVMAYEATDLLSSGYPFGTDAMVGDLVQWGVYGHAGATRVLATEAVRRAEVTAPFYIQAKAAEITHPGLLRQIGEWFRDRATDLEKREMR
jgi:hypothetical protein